MKTSNSDAVIGFGFLVLLLGALAGFAFQPKSKQQAIAPSCTVGSGRIWTGVKLYRDSSCLEPVATILGGKSEQVLIRFSNGSDEWKNRNVIANQMYVKTDDGAIVAQKWMKYR